MPKYIDELVSKQIKRSELAQARVCEHGEAPKKPVMTISRSMGSGARVVAGKLAEELGWSLWDKEIINSIAENADVSHKVVERFDERTVSEIESFARSVFGDHEMGGFIYARHLAKTIAAIAKLGNAIILGRGANFLLPKALNIRMDASLAVRIQNMMTYEDLTREEAEAKLRQSDRDRHEFIMNTFGREKVESARYDLTIRTDELRPDDVVEILKTALRVWCSRNSDQDSVL